MIDEQLPLHPGAAPRNAATITSPEQPPARCSDPKATNGHQDHAMDLDLHDPAFVADQHDPRFPGARRYAPAAIHP
jgi:hypothetical protein